MSLQFKQYFKFIFNDTPLVYIKHIMEERSVSAQVHITYAYVYMVCTTASSENAVLRESPFQ